MALTLSKFGHSWYMSTGRDYSIVWSVFLLSMAVAPTFIFLFYLTINLVLDYMKASKLKCNPGQNAEEGHPRNGGSGFTCPRRVILSKGEVSPLRALLGSAFLLDSVMRWLQWPDCLSPIEGGELVRYSSQAGIWCQSSTCQSFPTLTIIIVCRTALKTVQKWQLKLV